MIMTKQEKDTIIYSRFNSLLESGYSKTQATAVIMNEFNILSTMTVYNIRKRCK